MGVSSGMTSGGIPKDGGERGIRTLGRDLNPFTGLANQRFRPLSHLSRPGTSRETRGGQSARRISIVRPARLGLSVVGRALAPAGLGAGASALPTTDRVELLLRRRRRLHRGLALAAERVLVDGVAVVGGILVARDLAVALEGLEIDLLELLLEDLAGLEFHHRALRD